MGQFRLGPVQVNVIKIGELLEAFNDVGFHCVKLALGLGLHEGRNQPEIQFFLFALFLDVGNHLFQVDAGLGIFLLLKQLLDFLVLADHHVFIYVHCMVLLGLSAVRGQRVACPMLHELTFPPHVCRQGKPLPLLLYRLLGCVYLNALSDGFWR